MMGLSEYPLVRSIDIANGSHMRETTADSNKATALRFYVETFDNHNPDIAAEFLSPDLVFHNGDREALGHDGWRAFVEGWLTGFPNLGITVDFTMAEADRVLLHWRAQGTHTGEFRGVPATGRRVTASGLTLLRFSAGKIQEIWDEVAAFGELQTLTVD
jgi:steroid delta-isomerase-like uncharacterized protein